MGMKTGTQPCQPPKQKNRCEREATYPKEGGPQPVRENVTHVTSEILSADNSYVALTTWTGTVRHMKDLSTPLFAKYHFQHQYLVTLHRFASINLNEVYAQEIPKTEEEEATNITCQ
eukprot:scaffold18599_cov82-Skeletonema_dohrnii-CCMP3373.AAC.1